MLYYKKTEGMLLLLTLQSYLAPSHMSVYHEKMIEHYFIAECMQALGKRHKKLECLASRSGDSFGYDIVLICDGISKYVQIKTIRGKKTKKWKVNQELMLNYPNEFEFITVYVSYDKSDNMLPLSYKYLNKPQVNGQIQFPSFKVNKKNNIIQPSHLNGKKQNIDTLLYVLFP